MGDPRRPVSSSKLEAELPLGRVNLLEVDPDLGEWLAADEFARACHRCTAEVLGLPAGEISPWPPLIGAREAVAGLLVIRGLLSRKLLVQGRHAVELLGPGDVVQPSALAVDADGTLSCETRWKALEPVVSAVLDRRFCEEALRFPLLVAALLERSVRRSRSLLVRLSLAEEPRIVRRVHLVLWHLADRWGRVAPGGVVLSLRLSRTTLADLACTQRESVSRALTELARQDLVRMNECRFMLTGAPPADGRTALDLTAAPEPACRENVTVITPLPSQV